MNLRSLLLAAACLSLATPLMALPPTPEAPAASVAPAPSDAAFLATLTEPMPCEEVCCFPTAPGNTLCYYHGPEVKSCWYFWQYDTCEIS